MIKFCFENTYKLYLPIHLIYSLLIKKKYAFLFFIKISIFIAKEISFEHIIMPKSFVIIQILKNYEYMKSIFIFR